MQRDISRLSLSLTQKFLVFLFLVSVLPITIVGLASYQVARSTIEEQAHQYTTSMLIQQKEFLELHLEQIEGIIANISSVEAVTSALAEESAGTSSYSRLATQAQISAILDGYANLRGLVSLDIFTFRGGHYHVGDTLNVSSIRADVRDRIMLNARAQGAGQVWAGITENVNASSEIQQVVTVAGLIMATSQGATETRPIAVLTVNYDVSYLYDHFSRIEMGPGAALVVVDAEYRLVYHPERALVGTTLHRSLWPLLAGPRGSFTAAINDEDLVVTFAHLPRHNWLVLSLIPRATLEAGTSTIATTMVVALAVAFIIAGSAMISTSRSLVAPLRNLTRRFQLYRAGTPGWQAPMLVSGNDEIAELSRWFNLFSESLLARQEVEAQLRHQAYHDSLTGLPNRKFFLEELEQALTLAQGATAPQSAVLFLDLDRFKLINDSLGHAAGDTVLMQIANRVTGAIRAGDMLSRLGGDEFAILLKDLKDAGEASAIAERIQHILSTPLEVGGVEMIPQASIGIVMFSGAYRHAEDLLRDADTAMYHAKASGRACSAFFDRAMHQQTVERLRLEADLRRAIERDELQVFYQPIIDLASSALKGFEALVRWRHPERGYVAPSDFITVAEETDLIRQIDMWVLRTACLQIATWRRAGSPALTISINLSARNFQNPHLPEQIGTILAEVGLPARAVQLEITESTVMADLQRTIGCLEQFSAQGIHIAIDDFGTHYSSLAYLNRLPVDTVKIDRSFISGVTASADAAAITSAIIAMSHILGLATIAEGVETPEQRAFLVDHGCDAIQGFLISPPLPAAAAKPLLQA